LRPKPENADAVLAVAHQLEQQLKPNPLPTPGIAQAVPKAGPDSKTNVSPPPATNISGVTTGANEAVRNPTKTATLPPRQTNVAQPPATANVDKPTPEPETNSRFAYKPPAKVASGNRKEAQKFFNQGSDAQAAHRLTEAINAYRTAIQLDPGYFDAHYNLGLAATEAGNVPLALSAYEGALAIVPDSLDARYNFGLLLKQAGYTTDAINELEKLISKFPNDSRGHLALANLYAQQLHDNAQAREHYLKVLDVDPHNSQANEIRHWIAEHPQ
jgi:tetratricopeptide (TPR) repeat protein